MLFKRTPYSTDCPTCAYARDEDIDLSLRIGPNLLACRGIVNSRVSGVDKLAQDDAIRRGGLYFFRFSDSPFHTFGSGCEDEFCAIDRQQVTPLYGHRIRHGKDDAIAFEPTYPCESHTGVSAGRFDNRTSGG